MPWQKRNPPGERRASKHCAQAGDFYNNSPQSSPRAGRNQASPTGSDAAEKVADLRFQHRVEHVHSLGPRVTAELLAEIGSERSIQNIIDEKVERYAEIDLSELAAAGGDDFSPIPLHEVRR